MKRILAKSILIAACLQLAVQGMRADTTFTLTNDYGVTYTAALFATNNGYVFTNMQTVSPTSNVLFSATGTWLGITIKATNSLGLARFTWFTSLPTNSASVSTCFSTSFVASASALSMALSTNTPGINTNSSAGVNTNLPSLVVVPATILYGTNSPEGIYPAYVGSIYYQFDGTWTNVSQQWVKASGSSSNGWIQYSSGSGLTMDQSAKLDAAVTNNDSRNLFLQNTKVAGLTNSSSGGYVSLAAGIATIKSSASLPYSFSMASDGTWVLTGPESTFSADSSGLLTIDSGDLIFTTTNGWAWFGRTNSFDNVVQGLGINGDLLVNGNFKFGGNISGNGASLTNLNGANLQSGSVPASALGTGILTNGATQIINLSSPSNSLTGTLVGSIDGTATALADTNTLVFKRSDGQTMTFTNRYDGSYYYTNTSTANDDFVLHKTGNYWAIEMPPISTSIDQSTNFTGSKIGYYTGNHSLIGVMNYATGNISGDQIASNSIPLSALDSSIGTVTTSNIFTRATGTTNGVAGQSLIYTGTNNPDGSQAMMPGYITTWGSVSNWHYVISSSFSNHLSGYLIGTNSGVAVMVPASFGTNIITY